LGAGALKTVALTGTAISAIDVKTANNAINALGAIDAAISSINTSRAALGAVQNRFTSVVASLQTTGENLSASRSRIQDADFALETANLSRAQILQQAGTAMVAQANQLPQSVLSLLK
jgi:flagellin